jgi:predicted PurR-regulated permease PerM
MRKSKAEQGILYDIRRRGMNQGNWQQRGDDQVNWSHRRDILICVICTGIILWAAWGIAGQFIDAIIILLLSMAIAFLLSPLVNFLNRYRVPRVIGTLLIYVVVLAILGAFGYALIFSLIQQILSLSSTVIDFANSLPDKFSSLINFLQTQGGIPADNITKALDQIQTEVTSIAQTAVTNVLNIAVYVSNAFIDILLVIVISFYLTVDGKRIRDSIMDIIPRRSLEHALVFEDALNRVVGNYIRGQLTLALIIGVLASFVCLVTGLKQFALIVGAMAFVFETIPMVGPALASIPAILLSLLLPDPFPRTFYVILAFVIIQAIESNILGPRIVGHAVGLHPVASIFALIIGTKLFGAFGALLATPIVAAAWVVIASLYRSARGETADEILSHRRPTWKLPTPTRPFISIRRKPTGSLPDTNGHLSPLPDKEHVDAMASSVQSVQTVEKEQDEGAET